MIAAKEPPYTRERSRLRLQPSRGLLLLLAGPAQGHHSDAIFDTQHPITVTGVVRKVGWMNPHADLYLNVTDEKGEVHPGAVETDSPNFLKHNGWTGATVNPGEKIACTGAPAHFMHATSVQSQLRS